MIDKKAPGKSSGNENRIGKRHIIRRILNETCVIFTVLSVMILLIKLIVTKSLDSDGQYISSASFFLMLLPFSFTASVAGAVLYTKLDGWLRYCLHAVMLIGGFYLCILLPYSIGTSANGSQVVILICAFMVLYAAIMAVRGLIIYKKDKHLSDKSDYKSVYGRKS